MTPTWPGWIDEFRPDFVLTGHVHDPPFKPDGSWYDRIGHTWVFNPGRQIGRVPAHVALDLTDGRARGSSLLGDGDRPPGRRRSPGADSLLRRVSLDLSASGSRGPRPRSVVRIGVPG